MTNSKAMWIGGLLSTLLVAALGHRTSAAQHAPDVGSICVRREPTMPISDGLEPVPMRRGAYSMRVDNGPAVEVRADTGTRIPNVPSGARHRVVLLSGGAPVASTRFRLSPNQSLCVGVSNYGGLSFFGDGNSPECGCH